jgi:hypothetical protein
MRSSPRSKTLLSASFDVAPSLGAARREHALDPVYARKLGVVVDDLLISQPDAGEQALEIDDTLVRSGAIDVLVIDSVAALVPRAELEGEMGEVPPGMQARLMSQALRKPQARSHIRHFRRANYGTAMATAFFWPTRTTSRLPRVTPV